jgi:hypothetical protein
MDGKLILKWMLQKYGVRETDLKEIGCEGVD